MDMLSFWDDAMEKLYFGKGIYHGTAGFPGILSGIWQGFSGDIRPLRKASQGAFRDFGELSWNSDRIFQGYRGFDRDFRDVSVPRGIRDHPNKCICSYKCVSCIFKQVLFPESSPLSLKNPRSISRQGCIVRRVI